MNTDTQSIFSVDAITEKSRSDELGSKNKVTGITEVNRKKISDSLGIFLADTYILYLKTQNYHWNVTGPNFLNLHSLFMSQYVDLGLAVDLIAERIRALGHPAPGTFQEFFELASIREARGVQSAERMIAALNSDQEALIHTIRALIPIAENGRDFTTVDLLTQRLQVHEKNVWILTSFLQ